MLDEVSKIINFFNIGYKKEGIIEFKGIEKNLVEFKKDVGYKTAAMNEGN
jgi:hypothetical protein